MFLHRRAFVAALSALVSGVMTSAQAQRRPIRIVALGDSLTAGYGLPGDAAFPVQLERALRQRGHDVSIANAGVSGDTTAGGRERLDWSVPDGTDAVILELGANDALRGLPPERAEAALDAMLTRLGERTIPVLLAGMYAPRQMGPEYVAAFDGMYPRLAQRHRAILYPFFLDGVIGVQGMTLDGLHPTRQGVAVIVERILPRAEELLRRVRS